MNALDTNAIVRFLVRDDEKQAQLVCNLLLDAEKTSSAYFVTLPVVFETIWVLTSCYGCTREQIIGMLENLVQMPALNFQDRELLLEVCRQARRTKLDVSDILIGLIARARNCKSTLTFDRKAAKSPLFKLIK